MSQTRVLFVDDDPMLRTMWSTILSVEGFDATVAGTVPEALSKITSEKFDVLIADLNIGEPSDGFTIVSAMRRMQPEAVTLILTGYPAFQAALRAIREQVDDFLMKTTEWKTVVELIRQNLLRKRKPASILTERLNEVIAKNRDSIIESWYEAVERHPDIKKVSLSKSERIDDLPSVLSELVRPMEAHTITKPRAQSAASEHGAKRRKQGYSLSMLLEETRILHGVVADCMQKNLLSIDISNLIPDLVEVHERMQRILQYSLEAFLADGGVPRAA